jgi:hypothetical protein
LIPYLHSGDISLKYLGMKLINPSLTDYNISETLANYMTMVVDTKFYIQNIAMEEIKNNKNNLMMRELKTNLETILVEKQLSLDELFQKVAIR